MKRNSKGFVFVEFLVLTTVTLTFITGTFYLFFTLYDSYQTRDKYNSPDTLYAASEIADFVSSQATNEQLTAHLDGERYTEITDGIIFLGNRNYFDNLKRLNSIEKVFIYNLANFNTLDASLLTEKQDKFFIYIKSYINNYNWESENYLIIQNNNGKFGFAPIM